MKKSIFGKIGAAAVVLTLVTGSLVGGTFAKYTSTVTGKATVTVAKWKIDLTDGTNSLTTNGIVLTNGNTKASSKAGTVGPGANGSFDVHIDGSDTDVKYTYNLKLDTTKVTAPIKFYKTDKAGGEIPAAGLEETVDANTDKVVTVYWEWDSASDSADTTVGEAATGTAEEISLVLTANQFIETTP